jgi:hypothetical protein
MRRLKKPKVYDKDHRGPEKARKDPGFGGPNTKENRGLRDMMRTRGPEGQRSGIRDQRVQKNRGPEDLTA